VIVDELARSKAGLLHRSEQYDHQVRLLQHEHHVMWNTLADTNSLLSRLKSAFDPLTVLPEPDSDFASLLGLSDRCLAMTEALRERLIGSDERATGIKIDDRKGYAAGGRTKEKEPMLIDTPAEEGLKEVCTIRV
jgi:hypothetical protein